MSALASPPSAASLGSLKKAPEGRVGGVGVGRWEHTHTPDYHIDLEFLYIYIVYL